MMLLVSVPLSGLVSANAYSFWSLLLISRVSVPLSGLVSANFFPRPQDLEALWHVFVPLSGLVSVNVSSVYAYLCCSLVFVPLSGLVSVNRSKLSSYSTEEKRGFRPLIGVSFCKQ